MQRKVGKKWSWVSLGAVVTALRMVDRRIQLEIPEDSTAQSLLLLLVAPASHFMDTRDLSG